MILEGVDESDIGGTLNTAYGADENKLPGYHRQVKDALFNHLWASQGRVFGA